MSTDSIKIKSTSWLKHADELKEIRRQVFIEEQNVPEELEWDEYDESSIHFLALHDGKAIAVARLKPDGQIGRMAVLSSYRQQGIGSRLLVFILKFAASKNLDQVYLHAQTSAIPFYEKHGFITQGAIFYEANIPHRGMLKKIC